MFVVLLLTVGILCIKMVFMNMLVSISSRGLIYIPERVQSRLKIKRPGRLSLSVKNNKLIMRTLPDIMEFAGTLKNKIAPADFDFRKYKEENYERI